MRDLVTPVISLTTRKPRAGESHGIEYYFVSVEEYKEMEAAGELVESISFNDTFYGTSKQEFKRAMSYGRPLGMVLEPNGVIHFQHVQHELGFQVVPVFVEADEKLRDSRLASRLLDDITTMRANHVAEDVQKNMIMKFMSRIKATVVEEHKWKNMLEWQLIVPGNNAEAAVEVIKTLLR